MPTETEIRAALQDLAALAPETCSTFDRRRSATVSSRSGRRGWAISVCAAVVVAAVAVTSAVLAPRMGFGHQHGTTRAVGPSPTTGSPSPRSSARVAPAPADALRWNFTVDPIAGYTFAYEDSQPNPRTGQQNAVLTSTTHSDVSAGITVYPRGAFDPEHGGVDGTTVRGKAVSVTGRRGDFVSGPSTPMLFWTYADDAWASVGVSGTTSADALPLALRVARALRTDTPRLITLPFQVGPLPAPLKVVDVAPSTGPGDDTQSTVFYGTSFGTAHGIYLTVTRVSAARTASVQHKPVTSNRTISRVLDDGSVLTVTVEQDHLGDIDQDQLEAIAAGIIVTPAYDDPATWLPVLP